jgi:hypothetical protein
MTLPKEAETATAIEYSNPDLIDAMIGDKLCVGIHRSWVDTTYAELSEKYRAQGLEGDELHSAAMKDVPKRLADLIPSRYLVSVEDFGVGRTRVLGLRKKRPKC